MCNESYAHATAKAVVDAVSYVSSAIDSVLPSMSAKEFIPASMGPQNLDGIIELKHNSNKVDIIKEEIKYLGNSDNPDEFISDHIGIDANLSYKDFNFNIISYNLEGLCSNNTEFDTRKRNLIKELKGKTNEHTIMVCQEIILKDQIGNRDVLTANIQTIINILNSNLPSRETHATHFYEIPDTTSCIFFSESFCQ